MSYRAGWIHYTNVAPILDHLALPPNVSAITGVPTQMNAALLSGEVDIANISAVEFVRHADRLSALPDFSVSVLGPVYSVNLFHSVPWQDLTRVALTAQSATSVALLEVLLRGSGVSPVLERAEGTAQELLASGYDGVLRIGDSALREWYGVVGPLTEATTMTALPHEKGGISVTDLAQQWFDLTGHPFVFAVWAYRQDQPPPPELLQAMRVSRRDGTGPPGGRGPAARPAPGLARAGHSALPVELPLSPGSAGSPGPERIRRQGQAGSRAACLRAAAGLKERGRRSGDLQLFPAHRLHQA